MVDMAVDEHEGAVLPALHLGAPSQVGPLTLFPIWTDAPVPKKPTPLLPPDGAVIGELDAGPAVDALKVCNPTNISFALLEGTVVDGGWQHRVVIQDVLVAASQELHVGVRCVEEGRWRGESTQQVSRRRAPLAVSGALRGLGDDRAESRMPPTSRADQGEVWDRVASYQRTLGADAPTGSMVEVFDQVEVPDALRRRVPKPAYAQRGVLVGVDGHPAMLEIFEHPRSLATQWDSLIEGLLASTAHLPPVPTLGRRARKFVQRLSGRRLPFVDSAGAGFLAEDTDDLISVRCLANERRQGLHAAALNVRHRLVLAA